MTSSSSTYPWAGPSISLTLRRKFLLLLGRRELSSLTTATPGSAPWCECLYGRIRDYDHVIEPADLNRWIRVHPWITNESLRVPGMDKYWDVDGARPTPAGMACNSFPRGYVDVRDDDEGPSGPTSGSSDPPPPHLPRQDESPLFPYSPFRPQAPPNLTPQQVDTNSNANANVGDQMSRSGITPTPPPPSTSPAPSSTASTTPFPPFPIDPIITNVYSMSNIATYDAIFEALEGVFAIANAFPQHFASTPISQWATNIYRIVERNKKREALSTTYDDLRAAEQIRIKAEGLGGIPATLGVDDDNDRDEASSEGESS